MFRQLDPRKLLETTTELSRRVVAEFPRSGLAQVSQDVLQVAREAAITSMRISRPMWFFRFTAILLTVALIIGLGFAITSGGGNIRMERPTASDLAQGIEAAINDIIFAGVAIWFAFSLETRSKRRRALALIGQLRSLAHVIDLHQLTKDPHAQAESQAGHASDPIVVGRALGQYLDYCSDLLSILGKLAALCAHRFDDSVTLAAVKELEDLTNGLSRKLWQKIMIIDRVGGAARAPTSPAVPA